MAPGKKKRAVQEMEEEHNANFFEEYSSDDAASSEIGDAFEDDFEAETPAEKRVRLAKQYLKNISDGKTGKYYSNFSINHFHPFIIYKESTTGHYDAADLDRDIIADRLQTDMMESQGKIFRKDADNYDWKSGLVIEQAYGILEGHSKTITSMTQIDDNLFTASKDGNIIQCNDLSHPSLCDLNLFDREFENC